MRALRADKGFARLLPLLVLTGLAAGTIALLASARPVRAPEPAYRWVSVAWPVRHDGGCSDVPAPVPAHGIVDASGRAWELSEIPGHTLRGLDLRKDEWVNVDLHGATFIGCDFGGCELASADLRGVSSIDCDLRGADLDLADLTGALSYGAEWPSGFETPAEFYKRGMTEALRP